MNKYEPYSETDLNLLLHEPWEVSDRPYMLHAAFALSCLYDALEPDDIESDEQFTVDDIWGKSIPKNILDRLIKDIADDFNDSADNFKPVKIWGKPYSVRKVNAYDHNRLIQIFNFPLENNEYKILKEGVLNLYGAPLVSMEKYQLSSSKSSANRTYLRQVIKLAEDDENDGWNKLTDMEIAMYCWAMFYNKHQSENLLQFIQEYKDYIYVSQKEIVFCFNDRAILRNAPIGMNTFDIEKVTEWNKKHNQKSYASEISHKAAEDYWYDVALKTTFKPVNYQ